MSGNEDDSYKIELFVYDMSKGLAKQMSPALLGKQIEGIWHTGVVAYGREYFFGSGGIESCRPGGTILGEPERVEDLGCSQVPYQLFLEYIFGLGESSYKPGAYDLLKHNCNNFSEEVSEFLCGRGIPKNILTLPDEVLNTDLGTTLAPLAKTLRLKDRRSVPFGGAENHINAYIPRELPRQTDDPELDALNSAIEEVRNHTLILESRRNSLNEKLLKKEKRERKKEKKEKKKKKNRSCAELDDEEGDSPRRRKRGDSVHFAPDVEEPPAEDHRRRRFSEPNDLSVEAAHPSRLPRSPTRNHPSLPPPVPKKPPLPPSEKLDLPPSRTQTPSPVPSIEVTPTMDEDGTDAPLSDEAPLPPAQPRLEPEEEELPPEVPREPPILFKEEVDVSSRGSFGDVWSSSLSRSLSTLSSSTSSSEEDEEDDSSSVASSSSYISSSSSSYSCHSFSALSTSYQSLHDSNTSAFISISPGTSITTPAHVLSSDNYSKVSITKLYNPYAKDSLSYQCLTDDIFHPSEGNYRGSYDDDYANISNNSNNNNNNNETLTSQNMSSEFQCLPTDLTVDSFSVYSSDHNNSNLTAADNFQPIWSPKSFPSKEEERISSIFETPFSNLNIIPNAVSNSVVTSNTLLPANTSIIADKHFSSSSFKPSSVALPSSDGKCRNDFDKIRNDCGPNTFITSSNSTFSPNGKFTAPEYDQLASSGKNVNLKSDYSCGIIPLICNKEKLIPLPIPRPSDLPLKKVYEHDAEITSKFQNQKEKISNPSLKNKLQKDLSSKNINETEKLSKYEINPGQEISSRDFNKNNSRQFDLPFGKTCARTDAIKTAALATEDEATKQNAKSPISSTANTPISDSPDRDFDNHSSHYLNFRSSHRPKSKYLLERLRLREDSGQEDQSKVSTSQTNSMPTNTDENMSNSKIIPLPWYPSWTTTSYTSAYKHPSPIKLQTRSTSLQKTSESDSDSFYTPDSKVRHFDFPSSKDNETVISPTCGTPDSETFHTPNSCCPPFSFGSWTSKSTTPGTPKSTTPGTPKSITPGTPESTLPSTPKSTLPSTPKSATFGASNSTTPSTPKHSVPDTPKSIIAATTTTISTPESTVPSSPKSTTFGTSKATNPSTSKYITPDTPEITVPSTPKSISCGISKSTNPGTPKSSTRVSTQSTIFGTSKHNTLDTPQSTTLGTPQPTAPKSTTPDTSKCSTPRTPECSKLVSPQSAMSDALRSTSPGISKSPTPDSLKFAIPGTSNFISLDTRKTKTKPLSCDVLPKAKSGTRISVTTSVSNSDISALDNSSFSGISPTSPKSLPSTPTESKKTLESSESNQSFLKNPSPPVVSISCTTSEQVPKAEVKSDVCSRLPPPYDEVISNKATTNSDPSPSISSLNSSPGIDSSLSRSSTQSSVDSSLSFGSSYYTLYIVDPFLRPKTPEDTLWSPESSPPPEDLSRSASTASIDSLRTITPEPEYFEENNRAFRAMRGLSKGSSNDSLITCFSNPRSFGSASTLEEPSNSSKNLSTDKTTNLSNTSLCSTKLYSAVSFRSEPSSPTRRNKRFLKRTTSLDSVHSILRRYPDMKSPFGSISTFDLASCSRSPSPRPNNEIRDRPPSTDSPILFASPRGSQESLLLFRPVPRYTASFLSPEPEPTILCYLGPARPYEPSLTFTINVRETIADFDGFVHFAADMLSAEEQKHMEELRAYVVEDEGSWALGEDFNTLFARIFHDSSIPMEAQRHLIRIMAAAALKDDVILMLHQDRKEHTIMNFANKIESLPPEIQEALALFFCNMFEHLSPSEWLLYISEWQEGNQQISNIRVTTKIAVNALLHSNPKVQEYGTALMYNLGTKEVKTVVFDDVAPELAMAILQYFGNNPSEEYVWRVLTALCRFCYASSEVPALIKMIGPDPNTFKGMSERIDIVLEEVNGKLSRIRAF